VKTYELGWKSKDGMDLYARVWEPDQTPRAIVCLVHGLGEHIQRYEHVAAALTKSGYALMGYDQRGHGKSAGSRGHTPTYEALMEDVSTLLAQAGTRFPGLPKFLYGHSMGGNEVLNYALRYKPDIQGVIATGPFLRLAFSPPRAQLALAKIMNGIAPALLQKTGLKTSALSHDRKVVDAYEQDPLVHDKISVRLYFSLYESGEWAIEHASEFPLPLLLMHGSADGLTSADASREFARRGGSNVTLHIWEDWYHEIHNEPDQAEVFQMMIIWMDARLGS
jgi:acylglycerol lipase